MKNVYRFTVRRHRVREPGVQVTHPNDVAMLMRAKIGSEPREHFVAMFVDVRNQLLGYETVAIGMQSGVEVHPREVFTGALLAGAAAIICAHNHPSGDIKPSAEDIALTRRLIACGELMGIPVIDHLVVSDREHISMVHDVV